MPLFRPKRVTVKRRRISRQKFILLIKCFSVDLTATQTAKLLGLNRNTVNRYFSFFRQLVISQAFKEREQEKITNGVEVDESYMPPRQKSCLLFGPQ